MEDRNTQMLIENVLSGKVAIAKLSECDFYELLDGLKRMYFARVMNCVDASAKWDTEWCVLSDIFERVCKCRVS